MPLVFLAMRWKGISRGPSAFLEALPLALGWDEDARVWGKAEKVGRERKPTINSHLRAALDSLKQPSAEAQRKREGGKAPEMGEQTVSQTPSSSFPLGPGTFVALAGIGRPSRGTPRQRRGRKVSGRFGNF